MMSPVTAAVGGALLTGVVMFAVTDRTPKVDAFTTGAPVEYVQTVDGRFIPVTPATPPAGFASIAQPGYGNALRPAGLAAPAAAPVVVERVVQRPAPRQTVYRTAPAAQERVVVEREPARQKRSWQKTALVIGGSAASGAAVGGMVDGKKGALIGAALGGGAASIFEAIKR